MKTPKLNIALITVLVLISFFPVTIYAVDTDPVSEQGFPEGKIKTAYLYNFLRFVEWPENQTSSTHICIVGFKKSYHEAMKALTSQTINQKNISIKEFHEGDELSDLNNCQILFVTSNASHRQRIATQSINKRNILLVGEATGFAEQGGMINFINKNNTINFEVNLTVINQTDIRITSRILRIADKVYRDNDGGDY